MGPLLVIITPVTYLFSAIYSDCNSPFAKILGGPSCLGRFHDASDSAGTAQPAAGLEIREAKGMGVYVKAAEFRVWVGEFQGIFVGGWMVKAKG